MNEAEGKACIVTGSNSGIEKNGTRRKNARSENAGLLDLNRSKGPVSRAHV
jgi:hypothetical protein